MWTLFIFVNLGVLLCTVSSSPPSPINVVFTSVNLRNVLQWSTKNGTPDDTHFTVQYAIYGDGVEGRKGRRVNWRVVPQCTEIVRRWCELSNETWDLEQGYHARVRAVSRRASSKWSPTLIRFDPKSDTSFGPPLVSVDMEDNSAIITLKGPMRYQPNNHTPAVSMKTFYPHMAYNLSIHNIRRGQMSHFLVVSSPYKFRLMEYNTEYCFSAKSKFLSMPVQCHFSEWQCITTPPDPIVGKLQRVVVGIAVPSACFCLLVVAGYLLYRYLTGKGQTSPYILNPPSFHPPPLMSSPEKINILFFNFIKEEPSEAESGISDPDWQIEDPPPRYTPQRSETPPEPEEPWDDVSIDYGCVVTAPEINVRGEEAHAWPQVNSGLFQIPLNLQTKKEGGMGEEMDGKVRVRTDGEIGGGVEEGSQSEGAPPLPAYASQNNRDTSTSDNDQSELLSDDYGVLRVATAHEIEEDEDDDEDEEGTLCINWDPMTRKLVLPEMARKFNTEGGLDGLMQGEKGRETRMGGEEEEAYVVKGELTLENVFVRQASGEEAEAKREMERGGETMWEADDILSKWNLVISMDQ